MQICRLREVVFAADAGEHGKRFAVVAKEVRRLAERTVDATRQIRELIGMWDISAPVYLDGEHWGA